MLLWMIAPFIIGIFVAILNYAFTQKPDWGLVIFGASGILSSLLGAGLIWAALALFFKRNDLSKAKYTAGELIVWGISGFFSMGLLAVLFFMGRSSSLSHNTYEALHGLTIIPVASILMTIAGAVLTIINAVKKN